MDTETKAPGYESILHAPLSFLDPELYSLMCDEKQRQRVGLEMIGSENFTSYSVLECLSSSLHNKYSEGLPGKRHYGGNQYIDEIELLAQRRALAAFDLSPEDWGVNVQPYSGSVANFAVYMSVLNAHERIMGLDLPDGGHLTHGFRSATKGASASAIFFESMPYKVNSETGLIDYDALEASVKLFRPKMIIAGVSCYSRCLDYARFREICDSVDALLFADMAHVAGLMAAGLIASPFKYADIVSTTTNKTLRGPRAGIIYYRRGLRKLKPNGEKVFYDLEQRVNSAVFPGLQGGPHDNTIAGIATAFLQVQTAEFREYQQRLLNIARRLADGLQQLGYKIVTGGTDVHLVLVDLGNFGITGSKAEFLLEAVNIACNKNTVPGDKSLFNPSGIRLGTSALATRGFVEVDMDHVVTFIHRALVICIAATKLSGAKLVDFKKVVNTEESIRSQIEQLRNEIESFSEHFPLPGMKDI